jgi:hypothetical protein
LQNSLKQYVHLIKATGCVAACIGIWLRIDRNMSTLVSRIEVSTITLNADKVYFGTYVMISVGVALTFIGLIGVFGSIRENEYALWLVIKKKMNFCIILVYNCVFVVKVFIPTSCDNSAIHNSCWMGNIHA